MSKAEVLIYQTENANSIIEVKLEDEIAMRKYSN